RGAAGELAVGVYPPLSGKPPGFERGGVVCLHAARRGAGGGTGRPRQDGEGSGSWGLGESGNRGVSVPQSTPAEARQRHRRLKEQPKNQRTKGTVYGGALHETSSGQWHTAPGYA